MKNVLRVMIAADAASQMQTTADSLSSIVDQTSQQATMVAPAAQQASANVQTVVSIARNAEQASTGTGTVTKNIEGVTNSARVGGGAAQDVLSAATTLSREAQQMRELVQDFLGKVRAA
jgi:methyl-accepting chemotaxis protein